MRVCDRCGSNKDVDSIIFGGPFIKLYDLCKNCRIQFKKKFQPLVSEFIEKGEEE